MAKKDKKIFRQQIEQQLIAVFDLQAREANPKKFKRSLKEASRIIFDGLEPKKVKQKKAEKDNPKKKKAKSTSVNQPVVEAN
jgi:hypothetical protein